MNVPFVTFQCRDLKVFRVVYLQANRDFQKIITQARKNIFHAVFYILCISTRSFKTTYNIVRLTRPYFPPVALSESPMRHLHGLWKTPCPCKSARYRTPPPGYPQVFRWLESLVPKASMFMTCSHYCQGIKSIKSEKYFEIYFCEIHLRIVFLPTSVSRPPPRLQASPLICYFHTKNIRYWSFWVAMLEHFKPTSCPSLPSLSPKNILILDPSEI